MRFFSLENLIVHAGAAGKRFPLVLLSSGLATVAGMALVSHAKEEEWMRLLLTALLGLPTFVALTTTGDRARWSPRTRWATQALAVVLLTAFWLMLGRWTDDMRGIRFAHLVVLVHLTVAVLPFVATSLHGAFWQYNRILFLRFLTGALFAGVLFTGLAIALVAIDKLFGVKIEDEWYVRLWILIAFVFHPWFFLGGIPTDLTALETRDDYPPVLKVFAQFILIPVVCVYMIILTAYLVRVVATRTWPSGWIGYLVSSVAATGTLALLLVHPVRQRSDSRWVDAYGRWFFVALLPSIAMLLIAVWLRVAQYGLTERRYFLAILSLWLAGIALYYGVTGSRIIRIIPASLAVLAAATFIGPWSAYSVSRSSQLTRLRSLLGGRTARIETATPVAPLGFQERREISSILRYLIDTHGPQSLSAIAPDLATVAANPPILPGAEQSADHPGARAVMDRLRLRYVSQWEEPETERTIFFSEGGLHPVALDGYDWMTRVNLITRFSIDVAGDTLTFTPDSNPPRVSVHRRGERLLDVPLLPLLRDARRALGSDTLRNRAPRVAGPSGGLSAPTGPPPVTLEAEGQGLSLRMVVHHLTGIPDSARAVVRSLDATILLRLRRR